MNPTIIVHGGAGKIEDELHPGYLAGVKAAAGAGHRVLLAGGSALDAVEAAVTAMENDPVLNAGVGSVLNCAGEIELDAIIMDGRTLRVGAVAAVRGITNPVQLARLVAEQTDHCLLVGEGARRFAESKGLRLCAQAELTVEREIRRFRTLQEAGEPTGVPAATQSDAPHDTVGAVALDAHGNVAAATSTGGTAYKLPGRVGDAPLVGSGAYADNLTGAASVTGHGESIMRVVLAKTATDALARGLSAQQAVDEAMRILRERVDGHAGVILVDFRGQTAFAYNTPHMAVAWVDEDGQIHAQTQTAR